MSAISGPSAAGSAASLPAASLPLIDPAHEPAVIRSGNAAARRAYATGVAFEDMLVNQLAQEMTSTVPGLNGSSDGLGGTSSDGLGASGGPGSSSAPGGSALGAYSSLLPQTLAGAIESGGGTGMALQIARSLDPALALPTAPAQKGSA